MDNKLNDLTKNLKIEELSKKLNEYLRILKLVRRPSRDEFFKVSKIAGAAMALIGTIGYLMYVLMVILPKLLVGI